MSSSLARIARDLRTARHIPPAQLAHRLRFLFLRRLYGSLPTLPIRAARRRAAGALPRRSLHRVSMRLLGGGGDYLGRAADAAKGRFTHLGVTREYAGEIDWRDPTASPLWAYQMHYLGALVDFALAGWSTAAASHLASWRATYEEEWDSVAWHPYPVSLRLVNVCLAAAVLGSFDALGDGAAQLVATHARYLERHLERDVRGNHLLENAVALVTAAHFVDGSVDDRAALRLLRDVSAEQVLPDGMHYELAPMYHAIVLQRLLLVLEYLEDAETRRVLREQVERMLDRLAWMRCPDGEIPLLGDSVRDFALPVAALLDGRREAAAEGVSSATPSGLHVLRHGDLWCVFDTGPVCPPALPAHGQADALTVEVWWGPHCLVTDPGLHEYTGAERRWGRSSRAHSTITVDDRDSSEVYASFRVGGRETMESVRTDDASVVATLRPWGGEERLTRRVSLTETGGLRFDDRAQAPVAATVRSRLHLHPDVEVVSGADTTEVRVRLAGRELAILASDPLHVELGRCSRRFGELRETAILVLTHVRTGSDATHAWMQIDAGTAV